MNGRDESAETLSAGVALPIMGVERCGGAMPAAEVDAAALEHEPPRKRARAAEPAPPDLRRRLLDAKLARLKALRDKFTEQLSELYFLQAGGNMMDYAAWRKRAPAPQLTAFLEARRPREPDAAAPAPVACGAADEAVQKARAEAHVAARVAELARAGLWAERRLPRVLEPPRAKGHWDYLLEEMAWLAQDFAHERKWKKQAAKKCARAVQKYFQDKASAAQKAEKAQELQLRKIASFAAKEIKSFWSNVEKLVEWKRGRRVERARKAALDEQLSYIVDKTERYSRQLAANLRAAPDDDDEFTPAADEDDDEETIAAAEREAAAEPGELAALQREMSADLADLLPPGYLAGASPPPAAERLDSDDDEDDDGDDDGDDGDDDDDGDDEDAASASSDESQPLETLVGGEAAPDGDGPGERRVEAASTLAATLQPTGTTLSETAVATPVPRLLRHALREYQHVGLHWLATMHARRLNGILADEMGLGKTIQSIALLAHLALELGDWGPHLVVAPTSVVLNWELEFKKWCPAFKVLTYYGTIKERKLKRVGWTKANSFHVCITSYKLVVQDHQSFRRKRWKYLILDEAQNIKNFKSQRWQMLLNFQTERRLLLTGTPLQNSLAELWSLMHFLMPDVFASHAEFREWFAPVAALAAGAAPAPDALVRRLHGVLRPFLLRRLKADVERQMPRKYEHVLLCRLARRQRFLYDDFMARARTRDALAQGNLLSVINVLMQLRKVCNHPDLFEPRPVASPLSLPPLRLHVPALALGAAPRERRAARLGGDLASLEAAGAEAFPAHRARHLAPPRRLIEELHAPPAPPPRPPPAALRLHLRLVPRAPAASRAPPAPPPRVAGAVRPARTAPEPGAPAAACAAARLAARRRAVLRRVALVNERRCWRLPLYGADLRAALWAGPPPVPPVTLEERLDEMYPIIDKFSVCWQAARAPAARLEAGAGAAGWRRAARGAACTLRPPAAAALRLLHAPAARQAVSFPHPALLQYDCGKLQTLARLLRRLRAGGHRVLVFTQMTRALDVLERFLALHGHAYLRLDGATRVERRQALVERFNSDARLFAFLLSTRSGGVGLNLTGADCVVFYDSDWNPTMDAQAQDRCHRIGQTRDVHVFRLVTAGTVEENILRKAQQKRALGALAIEDGHFTTSYLRASNIKELFAGEAGDAGAEGAAAGAAAGGAAGGDGELDAALAAAEDEADAAAARAARAEACAELAEFDESQPLHEDERERHDRDELDALMMQLTPVERYAMRLVESSEAASAAERSALGEVRRQLREWEAARRELRAPESPPEPLTYWSRDAAQIWVDANGTNEQMPMWCPPTPPSGDGDVYVESWSRALYRAGPAPDALLPAPAPRRADVRRARAAARAAPHAPPPSLFERATARPRARARAAPAAHAHPPPHQHEWSAAEDAALHRALRLQRLPAEPPAALQPNWDWAAELVDEAARAYRSPRACRERSDALADPERARRKHRAQPARAPEPPRPPLARLDAMRDAAERRRAAPKRRLDDAAGRNPKHAALLQDHGVDYDAPPTPMEVASRRADRIAKEKQKAGAGAASAAPAPSAALVVSAPKPARRPEPRAPAPRPAAPAQLVYRQQALPARQHLKILHHAPAPLGPGAAAGDALRTLQLQQLALRRAPPAATAAPPPAPGAARPTHHVVVAHLSAPRAPPPDPAAH